jgi:hypothetical protein
MGHLARILNLGGLFNGSKTVLGIISTAYAGLAFFRPDYANVAAEILQILGISLLPVGVADKVRKSLARPS